MPIEAIYAITTVILFTAVGYGVMRYKLRSARAEEISEKAVQMMYRDPARFEEMRADLEDQARRAEKAAEA